MTPTDQRDILYHMASSSVIKAGGKNGEEGSSELWCLACQQTLTRGEVLLSWRQLNSCLLICRSELIPYFALLVSAAFDLLVKLSLSQPTSFPTFTLLLLLATPLRGE